MGQARNEESPFSITDMSIKDTIDTNARTRIKGCELVIVLCGKYTGSASGVSAELKIAQEESIPYFLLWGRPNEECVKPKAARGTDKIYKWTWENLKDLIGGAR